MKSIHPMFNKPVLKTETKLSQERKKPITKKEGRKERSDKLKDVRILLPLEQKKFIRSVAASKGKDTTHYTTELLQNGLMNINMFDFIEVNYPIESEHKVCAKISKDYFKLLQDHAIEWDCSLRKAAHRIFINVLIKEGLARI